MSVIREVSRYCNITSLESFSDSKKYKLCYNINGPINELRERRSLLLKCTLFEPLDIFLRSLLNEMGNVQNKTTAQYLGHPIINNYYCYIRGNYSGDRRYRTYRIKTSSLILLTFHL